MTHFSKDYNVKWYYNERHHGKGPMDGLGGTVKNIVFRHVKSNKIKISNAHDFAKYADSIVKGITSLYMAIDEVILEPEDVEKAPAIRGTLQIHKVIRKFNEDNVCKLEFFCLASESEPFHTQWYRKDGDPEVCGHTMLPLKYASTTNCAHCKGKYAKGEVWLKCSLCDQWFHEDCFHI